MPKTTALQIFFGTGGVGKTTLAASRAFALLEKSPNSQILLMTIDPAKRLKQVLGIENKTDGEIVHLPWKETEGLDVLLMNPEVTIKKISSLNNRDKSGEITNTILQTLLGPFGGMNELMALVELHLQLQKKTYDTIILDTPPGKNFVDFLQSGKKIHHFFDQRFIEIFKHLEKFSSTQTENLGLIKLIIQSGINKLLNALESVTGSIFIKDFVEAINIIYSLKNHFWEALRLEEFIQDQSLTSSYLVTAVDQGKIEEAKELKKKVEEFGVTLTSLILNKILPNDIQTSQATKEKNKILINILLERERALKEILSAQFPQIIYFPEILSSDPKTHVEELIGYWSIGTSTEESLDSSEGTDNVDA